MGVRTIIREAIANVIHKHIMANSLPTPIRPEGSRVVSVLLASRQRAEHLEATIDSLYQHAANPDDIEILIRLDNDDPQLNDALAMLKGKHADDHHITTLIGDRYGGFQHLHLFINELCQIARGDFFFYCSDDARMNTPNWDQIMAGYRNEICSLLVSQNNQGPKAAGYAFPAVHRKIYEIIGHFALYSLVDKYLHRVLEETGLEKPVPIDVIHRDFDRTDDPLDKSIGEEYRRLKRGFNIENSVVQREDIRKIQSYIASEGTSLK